jgi:hypothetical protein
VNFCRAKFFTTKFTNVGENSRSDIDHASALACYLRGCGRRTVMSKLEIAVGERTVVRLVKIMCGNYSVVIQMTADHVTEMCLLKHSVCIASVSQLRFAAPEYPPGGTPPISGRTPAVSKQRKQSASRECRSLEMLQVAIRIVRAPSPKTACSWMSTF